MNWQRGREPSAIHVFQGLDLPSDELGLELLLQRFLRSDRNERHARDDDLSSREGDGHSGVETTVEAILGHSTGGDAFSAVDGQPKIDSLIFRQVT